MRNISILDCTLRDGGCVNQFNFGQLYMNVILSGLEASGVEIIELGYIDEENGSMTERTQYCDEQVIIESILKERKPGKTYVAMCDYGKFNMDNLNPRTGRSIDGIRLAFHKEDRYNMIAAGRKIIDKGYQLYIQPMTIMRYSDLELIQFIDEVNKSLSDAAAFYIVDSFGEMRLNDMNRVANVVDHNLLPNMTVGFHAHNNLQLSYSNAVTLLHFPTTRNLIFDATIMGMGKGAGNMNTELFAEHLNLYYGKHYQIQPLLEVIDNALNQIRENYSWGYSVEYYLSAINHCSPSYASFFYKKHMFSINQVAELLAMINENKKISFDKDYAASLYYEYNTQKYNDLTTIEELGRLLEGKKVLLIAPGKSIISNQPIIEEYASRKDVIVIGVNNNPDLKTDCLFVTKSRVFDIVRDSGEPLILTSNVSVDSVDGRIINYNSWTKWKDGKSDNALVIIMNLLRHIKVTEVLLAGFDGFSADIDENYYDEKLKRPIDKIQAKARNAKMKTYLSDAGKDIVITFLTQSKYEEI